MLFCGCMCYFHYLFDLMIIHFKAECDKLFDAYKLFTMIDQPKLALVMARHIAYREMTINA